MKAVKNKLESGLIERFRDLERNILYAESTLLDPRFKQMGFKDKQAYQEAFEAIRTEINVVDSAEPVEINPVEIIDNDDNLNNSNNKPSIWDDYDLEMTRTHNPADETDAGTRELDRYINEKILARKQDPLAWWKERKLVYPRLYAYMLKRLCIVATSVPCERVFSGAGQVLCSRRTLLKHNKVSKLIFLHGNM